MSSAEQPLPVAQEPSPFEVAVHDRSWEWLLELRRRLKIDLLLVDARPSVVLPTTLGDQPSRVLGRLEHRDPVLLAAISTVLKTRSPRVLDSGGSQIVCVPVGADVHGVGVLVLGRPVPTRQESTASRAQLELVASWLSTAVEAHLQSPPAFPASGVSRVAPLAQLLGRASERESDRELIRLFGEAIAVWHDIEMSGYVETADEAFARDVTLPGTRRGDRPALIPSVGLPESSELTRLPQGHLDRFGLPVNSDVFVRRFKQGDDRSWLVVFTGVIDSYDLQKLAAYVALLELALSLSMASATARLVATISGILSSHEGSPEERTRLVLEEVRIAVGAASASVVIESDGGTPVLRESSPPGGKSATSGTIDEGDYRLVLVKRSERHYTTTVSLGRHESLQFTPRDCAIASAAADTIAMWSPALFASSAARRERRSTARGFPEVLERSAGEAIERGQPVAVVVLLVKDGASSPGSTQRWVAGIRGQMRASDLAGMLSEGEIGLLMPDTGATQAKTIAERLRTMINGVPAREAVLIGVAARNPQHGSADGIVHDARADAVARTRGPRASSPHGVNR